MTCPACQTDHRGECARCPHNADVTSGLFKDQPFETTPCSACAGAEDRTSSDFELFDNVPESRGSHPEGVNEEEAAPIRQFLVAFFETFLRLSWLQRDVLVYYLLHREDELVKFARERKIAPQAAHRALCEAKRKFPQIAALIRTP